MTEDAQAILCALKFDLHWLLEESNRQPAQFFSYAEELYSLMNIMQLVTSRLARVCNDNRTEFDRDLDVIREVLDSEPRSMHQDLK